MRRELYRVWIISHCCSKVTHKPTSRCFVLITMQVEAFLSTQRANRVFRSCFVHMFQTTTLGTFVVVLVVRGRADGSRRGVMRPSVAARKAASASPENGMAQHRPQPAVMEPGNGMMRPGTPASRHSCSHSITSKVLSNDTIILRSWSRASPDGPSRCASRYAAAAASSSAVCPQPPQPQVQGSEPSQVQGSPVSGQIS